MKLYTNDLSPFAQIVELYLARKGLPFEKVQPTRDEVRNGNFEAVNPVRKLPVLVVDGKTLAETQVIIGVIEEMFPQPSLKPSEMDHLAHMMLVCRIADIYIGAPLIEAFNNHFGKNSPDIADYARGMMQRGVAGLENWLVKGRYAIGDRATIADCVLPPVLFHFINGLQRFGIAGMPEAGPKTRAYFDAIQADAHASDCLIRMEAALNTRLSAVNAHS